MLSLLCSPLSRSSLLTLSGVEPPQYVYSAWAPQFADKLHLTATESNLIGLAGNLGMYSMGVPIGMVIDARGPRPGVIVGSILLGLGYFPIKQAFDSGAGSVALLCFFSYLSGLGGCMAFNAAVKTSALNWPHHRGTATAFPLAAFGLSAFFFSLFGSLFFPGDTSDFLMLLAVGTFGMTLVGFFFLRVLPHTPYHALPADAGGDLRDSQQLRRTSSEEAKALGHNHRAGRAHQPVVEAGTSSNYTDPVATREQAQDAEVPRPEPDSAVEPDVEAEAGSTAAAEAAAGDADVDETSSLMSKSSSLPGDVLVQNSVDMDRSHRVDIRGWRLLRNFEFWQFFAIMGILAGIGLMTIKYVPPRP